MNLREKPAVFGISVLVLALAAGLFSYSYFLPGWDWSEPFYSIEGKLAAFSPMGILGGAIIPASCESGFEHVAGECQPLSCNPATQTVAIGEFATFSAGGGSGTYAWSAPNGTPPNGSGSSFSTSYSTSGAFSVTAMSAGLTDDCSVSVSNSQNVCTPSAGSWSECAPACNGTQTRIITDINCNAFEERRSCNASSCADSGQPACTFEAQPSIITAGQESDLVWNCLNTTSCSIDQGIGSVDPTTGLIAVRPTSTIVYRLSCAGSGGQWFGDQTVRVEGNPTVIEVRPR